MTASLKIAYLANYQGEDLVVRRRLVANRSLAGTQKIAAVSMILAQAGCQVRIFSLGAVAERSFQIHREFRSAIPGPPSVPVSYQADWDVPVLGRILGGIGLLWSLLREYRTNPPDIILLYNCGPTEAIVARVLSYLTTAAIVLEYEDDAWEGEDGRRSWRQHCHSLGLRIARSAIRGVVAASPELRAQFDSANGYVLRGILSEDLGTVRAVSDSGARPQRFLFAGSLQAPKGVDTLCAAWAKAELPNCELHIVGAGPLLNPLKATFGDNATIRFHGFVPRARLLELFSQAHVLVNPHCVAGKIGAVFPFKLIEYLGTGRPVISTPMAPLPGSLASGVLYSRSARVDDLVGAMRVVYENYREWLEKAQISRDEAWRIYGSHAACDSVLKVLREAARKAA